MLNVSDVHKEFSRLSTFLERKIEKCEIFNSRLHSIWGWWRSKTGLWINSNHFVHNQFCVCFEITSMLLLILKSMRHIFFGDFQFYTRSCHGGCYKIYTFSNTYDNSIMPYAFLIFQNAFAIHNRLHLLYKIELKRNSNLKFITAYPTFNSIESVKF